MKQKHAVWAIVAIVAAAFLLTFGLLHSAHAQTPPAPTAPHITEVQQLKLSNIELQREAILREGNLKLQSLDSAKKGIITDILNVNPGYEWHYPQHQGDQEGLVKIPSPTAPTKPAAKK